MHYKNGREAKVGDKVLLLGDDHNPPRVGILYGTNAQSDTCNGKLARIEPNDAYVTIEECLHVDDVKAATVPSIAALVLILFALFACFAGTASAADAKAKIVPIQDPTALYKAGEVQVEALAFTDTDNLNDFDSGGGVALTYWHFENFGAGFEGRTKDLQHAFFDTLGLNLAGRAPLGGLGLAAIGRVGFDYHAEQVNNPRANEFDVYVGVGVEKRIHDFTIGAEVRGVRAAERQPREHLQFALRVGRTF